MNEFHVRKARREDCKEIMRLTQELADFEKMPDGVKINAKTLEEDGFNSENPPFKCLVVEDPENKDEEIKLIGYACYSVTYGTWEGRRYWLEDLIVTNSYRGKGVGKKLFVALCKEAVKENIVEIRYVVLDWNPAIEFYKKFGMRNITKTEDWQFSMIPYSDIVRTANM